MWTGGMMFNNIVVQYDAIPILEEFRIDYKRYRENYKICDFVESISAFNLICKKGWCKDF